MPVAGATVARALQSRGESSDPIYAAAAKQRIGAARPLPEATLANFVTPREAPRVPFATLVERGLVRPGARLVDARRKHAALVRPDGAVAFGDTVASIHRAGALAQGLEACNGWAFWHVDGPQGLTPIDALRAQVRASL